MPARSPILFALGYGVLAAMPCGVPHVPTSMGDALYQTQAVASTVNDVAQMKAECDRQRDSPVTVQEENDVGGAVSLNWVQGGQGWLSDRELNRYLNSVGKNLAGQSARPAIDWTFAALKSDGFNAVSAPGGYVFVSRGLLRKVANEAELAGVLAHEIAHVTERHALKTYNGVKCYQLKLAEKGSGLAANVAGGAATSATGGHLGYVRFDRSNFQFLGKATDEVVDFIAKHGFSKEDEFQADAIAAQLLANAGYDPGAYVQFLGKIPAGQSGGFFANHPPSDQRQQRLRDWLARPVADSFAVDPQGPELKRVELRDELKAVR